MYDAEVCAEELDQCADVSDWARLTLGRKRVGLWVQNCDVVAFHRSHGRAGRELRQMLREECASYNGQQDIMVDFGE